MNWEKCRKFQKKIQKELILEDTDAKFNNLAAFDISFKNKKAYVAAVVYNIRENKVINKYKLIRKNDIKYVSTFLAFREIPYILRILQNIEKKFELILCDGHGIMHPFNAGLATHLGYLLDIPAIGVAKSYLCGEFDKPSKNYFDYTRVLDKEQKVIGFALTNRKNTKPIFISPGYKISFEKSLELIKLVSGKYKVPEPIHIADRMTKELRLSND